MSPQITRCVYHSYVWASLVEQGYVTMTVHDHPDGHQIAVMCLPDFRGYRFAWVN